MNNKKFKELPLSIIEDAVKGEEYALQYVLSHFHSYIKTLSTKVLEDEQGNKYYYVDEDMMSRLEAKLIFGIVNDFKIRY